VGNRAPDGVFQRQAAPFGMIAVVVLAVTDATSADADSAAAVEAGLDSALPSVPATPAMPVSAASGCERSVDVSSASVAVVVVATRVEVPATFEAGLDSAPPSVPATPAVPVFAASRVEVPVITERAQQSRHRCESWAL
jgi:hypothetical protein